MADFKVTLAQYQREVDSEVEAWVKATTHETEQQYGLAAVTPLKAYADVLGRGGKRLRGVLAMRGYYMAGGQDKTVARKAALVMELVHAYLLVIDDIQDRSELRRGGPAAHILLAEGRNEHVGQALAINGALAGLHMAEKLAAELSADATRLLNEHLTTTIHGQSLDISNELNNYVTLTDVENVMELKTANYSILLPLQFGMTLADASQEQVSSLRDFAMHLGRAFQLTDDLIGLYGNESGKNPKDDIREGKKTVLMIYTLDKATDTDKQVLTAALGNEQLSDQEFTRCLEVIERTGAKQFTQQLAVSELVKAKNTLTIEDDFLSGLLGYVQHRVN